MSARKLGRTAAVRPVGLRDLAAYMTDPLPAAPAKVDPPSFDWGMLGNGPDPTLTVNNGDPVGDCTIAGLVHLREANAVENRENETDWPTSNEVVTEYLKLTGGADTGLVEANVLRVWHTVGLFGDRIPGYAPFDHRSELELRSVVHLFGGAYLGVAVPEPADSQFANGQPWDLTGRAADQRIEGGHCVPVVGYDVDYCYVVTWGALQRATWRWMATYLQEAWCVLTTEDARVDLAVLQADLRRLT